MTNMEHYLLLALAIWSAITVYRMERNMFILVRELDKFTTTVTNAVERIRKV